ncbi:MAG: hypothetical protein U1F25_14705 [Rubrivivax sp.]
MDFMGNSSPTWVALRWWPASSSARNWGCTARWPTTRRSVPRTNKTGCNRRLVREWLSAQVAAGYIGSPTTATSCCRPSRRWRWPSRTSPVFVAGGASAVASMYMDKDKIIAAMRGNGGRVG